jgi:hypothetical protein
MNEPLWRLGAATLGVLAVIKALLWLRARRTGAPHPVGASLLLWALVWPDPRPETFSSRTAPPTDADREFMKGALSFAGGLLLFMLLALTWPTLPGAPRSFAGILALFMLLHLGAMRMLFAMFRLGGWPVEPLFRDPLRSASLREFWGRRWNLAFVAMNRRLFRPLFPARCPPAIVVLGLFLVSGALHELAISFPTGSSVGGPFAYFALNGVFVIVESRLRLPERHPLLARLATWAIVLLPLPLLFPAPFRGEFIDPLFAAASGSLRAQTWAASLVTALEVCGLAHFLVLAASVQVPARLQWADELPRLGRFNRKIFWTYGGYIVFCIIGFGAVDLLAADALLRPEPAATAILLFIAMFWTGRIVVDAFYFRHEDWPRGELFVVGHTCLTSLFVVLAAVHWGALAWQTAAS